MKETHSPSTVSLSARTSRYGKQTVTFEWPAESSVKMRFEEPALLDIVVSGTPPSKDNVHFSLKPKTKDKNGNSHRRTSSATGVDDQGQRRMGPIQPGVYEFTMSVGRRDWNRIAVHHEEITLTPGLNSVAPTMPSLSDVTVTVTTTDGKQPELDLAQIRNETSDRIESEKVDKNGRALFPGLPPGNYKLSYRSGSTRQSMDFTLPGPTQLQFVAKPPKKEDAYKVTIRDAKGSLAACGLKTGDLIVGIDEIAFTDRSQIYGVFQGKLYLAKGTIAFHVLRDGSRITVTADPKTLRDYSKRGGRLSAVSR